MIENERIWDFGDLVTYRLERLLISLPRPALNGTPQMFQFKLKLIDKLNSNILLLS